MPAPRKPQLSPTKIATYLTCAVKYRYVYIDKIGKFFARPQHYNSFGATLHRVLENFHRQEQTGELQSAEQMLTAYQETWSGAGFKTVEQEREYLEAGVAMVQAYHTASVERHERAQQSEIPAVETLYTEKSIRADMGSFVLMGRVDRVDRHADGSLEIVDYKSGRLEVTAEEVAGDLAMNIYQLILRQNFPDTPVSATIYCLRSGVQASASLSVEEAQTFAQDIRALGEEILKRDYDALEPVLIPACEMCDFRPKCDRFWRQQARYESLQDEPSDVYPSDF